MRRRGSVVPVLRTDERGGAWGPLEGQVGDGRSVHRSERHVVLNTGR